MAIKGSLREASLPDVCQLLALGQKTGCLSVTDRSRFGQIYFQGGRITYARVVNRRDRLGDLLVRDGVVTREQLEGVLALQERRPDQRLGELLRERGFIAQDELARYVRIQIEEAIYHLFTWSRGTFYFELEERPDPADILVSVNPESLLLEAARRVDEWSLIEKKIPSLDLVFEVERERLAGSRVELTEAQREVVPLLDGRRSVQEVADASGLTEFEVGKALFGLLQAGFCHRVGRQVVEEGRRRGTELAEQRNLGLALFQAGMLEEAERELTRVLELDPRDLAARFQLAVVALRDGRPAAAVDALKGLLEEHGPRFSAYLNLAVALSRLERHGDGLLALAEAETLNAGAPVVALTRAVLLTRAHRLEEAEAAFAAYRAAAGQGRLPERYFHYAALAAAAAGAPERAARLVAEGLALHPSSAALHVMAGLVHERAGALEEAEASFRRAVELDPGVPQVHKNLGDVLLARGLPEEALEHYRRAADLAPELGDDLHAKMGNILYRRRQRADAVRHWTRALELNPENAAVRNNLEMLAHAG